MKDYEVTGKSVTINGGDLRLTREQADARHYALNDLGKGIYRVLRPVQFKKGEEFGYDGDLPKSMAHLVSGDKDESKAPAVKVTLEEFRAAVSRLDPENEDHRTKSGKPDVKALESVGGIKISGKQRDALWPKLVELLEAEAKGDESKGDESKGDESKGDESKGDESKGDESKGAGSQE